MTKNKDGLWEVSSSKVAPGRTYLYSVEDCHGETKLRVDPVSFTTQYIPEAKRIESVVVNEDGFTWHDQKWLDERGGIKPLSIYEVQLKSWKKPYNASGNFREIAKELVRYVQKLHFTHVELYAVQDHVKPYERGYQVENYFAPYHLLGSSDDLKYLIDLLHQNGIGVIVDWVLAHYHHSSNNSSYASSLYKIDGTDLVGGERTTWNTSYLDYSKEETRRLLQASALYWIEEMHVDGLRLDAISQMVYRDASVITPAVDFLRELNTLIHKEHPSVLMIAEDTGNFPKLTKPQEEGGLGFDMKWGIGWNRDSMQYFRTSFNARLQHDIHHKFTHFMKELEFRDKEIFTQSHDDSDTCGDYPGTTLYNAMPACQTEVERFANMRNFFSWQILSPSRGHLIHMGDELGQSESWYERFERKVTSVDWSLEGRDLNQKLQKCVHDLIALYRMNPPFWENGEMGCKIIHESAQSGVLAYSREGKAAKVIVIHNFSANSYPNYELPLQAKKVDEIFNSDRSCYGGSSLFEHQTSAADAALLKVSLAPHSTLVLNER